MKSVRKRIYKMIASAMLLVILAQNTAFAEETARNTTINSASVSLETPSAILMEASTGTVLFEKNADEMRSPASITKIMTALVTLKYGNMDDIITVTPIVKDIEYGSSVCDIKEGDVLSLRQLLYGLMIASGNDAGMMIAEHVGGSVDNFVNMMNEEARQI